MCHVMTGDIGDGDALLDSRNYLLVLAPHLSDIERCELARRLFAGAGQDDQLTDDGLTAICLCGFEVDVSAANEGEYILA
jgi:hypothetical protein